jgi:retron-type reverse transcriptase
MKKILLLTLLTTFTFSQAEEWIYYQMNASNGNGDLSIYIIKPDGTENELVIDTIANDILERFFPFHPSFI